MTSTQEPNIIAPQSALCICSRKWQAKLIVPICFGTKTSKFWLRIISFSSLESELSFDLKDPEINFDRAHSATQREITAWPWSFGSNLQYFKQRREDLFVDELFVYQEWKARYEVEEQGNESRKEKSRTTLDGEFDTQTQGSLACLKPVYSCRQPKMYFVKVWLFY